MKNLIKKFKNKTIQNDIITNSKEFISFARTFKNDLKKILKEINGELISFTIGHYFISAFIRKNEKIGYISYHLDRNMPVNIEKKNILYRTAEHPKDFSGGRNQFTSIKELEETLKIWKHLT